MTRSIDTKSLQPLTTPSEEAAPWRDRRTQQGRSPELTGPDRILQSARGAEGTASVAAPDPRNSDSFKLTGTIEGDTNGVQIIRTKRLDESLSQTATADRRLYLLDARLRDIPESF